MDYINARFCKHTPSQAIVNSTVMIVQSLLYFSFFCRDVVLFVCLFSVLYNSVFPLSFEDV